MKLFFEVSLPVLRKLILQFGQNFMICSHKLTYAASDCSKNWSPQVTYGKDLLINMQKLLFGAYLPDFTS